MLRTAWLLPLLTGLSTLGSSTGRFPPDTASLLPGSLTTTGTGLSPAGDNQLPDTHDHTIRPTALRSDRWCPLDTQ
jgi:hypothetical protein